jgi:hypothetical protein
MQAAVADLVHGIAHARPAGLVRLRPARGRAIPCAGALVAQRRVAQLAGGLAHCDVLRTAARAALLRAFAGGVTGIGTALVADRRVGRVRALRRPARAVGARRRSVVVVDDGHRVTSAKRFARRWHTAGRLASPNGRESPHGAWLCRTRADIARRLIIGYRCALRQGSQVGVRRIRGCPS